MRVLLISANTEKINMPTMPLGLALVSAAARQAHHEVRFLDLMFVPDPASAVQGTIAEMRPEVIGISIRNIDDQERGGPRFLLEQVRPIIGTCRECSSAPLVIGGAGYSIFPAAALAYLDADFGIPGDGEAGFIALLRQLEGGGDPAVPGVQTRDSGATAITFSSHLDDLPLAEDELWSAVDPQTPGLWVPVQSRRGCPNDCVYCSTAAIQGRAIRSRSPSLVVEHLARLAKAGFARFYFVDNSFNIPEAHALEICAAIRQLGLDIEWRCILYPHRVSESLVREMRSAGCVEVALGFESGCDEILQRLNKRFTVDDVRRTSQLLVTQGIRRMGFLLLGGPGETRASVERSLALAEELDLEGLRTTIGIRIYPNTPLARTAIDEGVIEPDDDLLLPRFYLAAGLEEWIHQRVKPGVVCKQGSR